MNPEKTLIIKQSFENLSEEAKIILLYIDDERITGKMDIYFQMRELLIPWKIIYSSIGEIKEFLKELV